MGRLMVVHLFCAAALAACNGPTSRSDASGQAPDLSSWAPDGASASVAGLTDGAIKITPLRGDALTRSEAGVAPRWCGARLDEDNGRSTSLVLVGTGMTEALSCTGVQGFGRVPAPKGGDRIAFVYKGSSPNTDGVITAVIVERTGPSAAWQVNGDLSYKLDETGTLTSIPAIRAWLNAHPGL